MRVSSTAGGRTARLRRDSDSYAVIGERSARDRLARLGRAAGSTTDVPSLFGAFLDDMPQVDGPRGIRALLHAASDEIVSCLFAADMGADGVRRVRQEVDLSVLEGSTRTGGEGTAELLDGQRLMRARVGVPDWVRAGLWIPTPGAQPAMAGLIVLADDEGGPTEIERAYLEPATQVVAAHVARLLALAPVLQGLVSPDTDVASAGSVAPQALASRLRGRVDPFQALIEHSHDATLLMDAEATILYASPAAERTLGIPAQAQVGQWGLGLIHPEDLPALQGAFDRIKQRPGDVARARGRVRRADGAWRWVSVTVTNLLEDLDVGAVVVNYVDVTEAVEAQGELESNARRWRALLQHSRDVIVLIDPRGGVRYVNEALVASTGYSPDEMIGTNAFDLLHEDDRERIAATMEEVVAEKSSARLSYRLLHADGSWRWWEAVASYREGDGGDPELVVNARDVTERQRAFDEAERQRRLLSEALDALPGPFYLFDGEGRYVLWNETLERATGLDAASVARAGPLDFVADEDRDDVARAIETTFSEGQATVEARLVTAAGATRPHLFTGRRVELDGGPHLVGMGVDLTERVEAQERVAFQARLLEQVENAVLATDLDNRVTYWNPAAERLFGWRRDEAIGRHLGDLTVAGDAPARRPLIFAELRDAGQWSGEIDARDKSGRLFPIRTTVARIDDARGEPAGFVTVASDDSERQRHERERQHLLEHLSERVKELRMLHDAARTFEDEDVELATLVQRLAERLPTAWRFPDDTAARVEVDGHVGETEGFARTPWMQTESVRTVHGTSARIEVAYRHGHEGADEGPFLREERSMLASLIQMLRSYVERRHERAVNARLAEQLGRQVDRLAALQRIDAAIISSNNLSTTLDVVFEQVMRELGVDAVDVLLVDAEQEALVYSHGVGFRTGAVEGSRLPFGVGYAGRAARTGEPLFLPDAREADPPFDRPELLEREGFVSYVALPLIAKGEVKGLMGAFHRERLDPDEVWWDFATTLAQQTAIAIDNWRLLAQVLEANGSLEEAYDATIEGWAKALDLRDEETAGHSARVTEMTVALARRFGFAGDELRFVRWGALLHDIGKMGVPDRILLKPGALDADEWALMQRHTEHARDLLLPISFLRNAVDIPYSHHERFDGSGYPTGLAGTDIPLAARIFAVVDVYDAVTSDRPYRSAWSRHDAIEHIREQSGHHFDPAVVDAFLAYLVAASPEDGPEHVDDAG